MTTTITLESSKENTLTNQFLSLSLEEKTAATDRHGCGNHSDKKSDPMQHRLNRLELEQAYLSEQNAHLTKELSFARYTIHALRNITTQKETALQATRQELDRAYFRIRMLGMTLLRQEQQLLQQQQQLQLQHHYEWPTNPLDKRMNYHQDEDVDGERERMLKNDMATRVKNHQFLHDQDHVADVDEEQENEQEQVYYYQENQQQPTPPESPRAILDHDRQKDHNDDDNQHHLQQEKCLPPSTFASHHHQEEKQHYHHLQSTTAIPPPSPSSSTTITTQ